jgi:hypothetical protein
MDIDITSIVYFPLEILINVLKFTDVLTVSKLCCVNKHFNNTISSNLWMIIDELNKQTDTILIPKTIYTYNKYRYLIDWNNIIMYNQSHNKNIPEDVIVWIPDIHDLQNIITYQTLSEETIRAVYQKTEWSTLLLKQTVPLDIIYNIIAWQSDQSTIWFLSTNDWFNIWSYQKVDCEFVSRFLDKVEWYALSSNKEVVSFDFISKFGDQIIWQEFTKHGIHENILEFYVNKFDFICWNNISRYTELSDRFIRLYLKYLDIGTLIRYQSLSNDLLNEIVDNFNDFDKDFYMQNIGTYQKISRTFIERYKSYLPLRVLIRNKLVPRSYIHNIYGSIDFSID